jgi:hypothetical protein
MPGEYLLEQFSRLTQTGCKKYDRSIGHNHGLMQCEGADCGGFAHLSGTVEQ